MAKLIFGCGYLGSRVARLWAHAGHKVFVVTRWASRVQPWRDQGLFPLVADVTRASTLADLPRAETVLYAVGFDHSAGSSAGAVYLAGLRAVLDALPDSVGRFLYISSTGVFGQTDGGWVDEESVCQPTRPTGKACWEAERLLRQHPIGAGSVVLRMAGIYGPERVPRRADLLRGEPIRVSAGSEMNLIHVDDAAQIVLAAEQRAATPGLFLVSDGNPVSRREYARHLARLLGVRQVRFEDPPPDGSQALRASTHKRVRNTHMLRQLNVTLRFPSYREGLAAIVAGP